MSIFSVLVSLLTLVVAGADHVPPLHSRSKSTACDLQLPTSSLPQVPGNTTLKFVALGVGTQNYTCTGEDQAGGVTLSNGAVATLFDITETLCTTSGRGSLRLFGRHTDNTWGFDRQLGHHYFTPDLVPTFDLLHTHFHTFVSARKNASVPAPGQSKLPLPSIDWLYLVPDRNKPNTGDIAAVYRVNTLGGVAPFNCVNNVSVFYMAQYWFYG